MTSDLIIRYNAAVDAFNEAEAALVDQGLYHLSWNAIMIRAQADPASIERRYIAAMNNVDILADQLDDKQYA